MLPPKPLAAIFGMAALTLSEAEARFFAEADPLGFILFQRNCETPDQVHALVTALRETVGRAEAPVLIDQEGGRVARLCPPHWPAFPPAANFGALYAKNPDEAMEAATLGGRLVGHELARLGVSVDCAPVLDVPQPGSDPIIGDRAFATTADDIAKLGRAFADGLMAAGVTPVIKHIPGHGRGLVDSHKELPTVDATVSELAATDFAPFQTLAYLPWAMTAHVVYADIDNANPATLSALVIEDVIRKQIGFRGFLISDDLSMQALSGTMTERTERARGAGCDAVLHCNADMAEMEAVAAAAGQLSGPEWARYRLGRLNTALADDEEGDGDPFNAEAARKRFDALMADGAS